MNTYVADSDDEIAVNTKSVNLFQSFAYVPNEPIVPKTIKKSGSGSPKTTQQPTNSVPTNSVPVNAASASPVPSETKSIKTGPPVTTADLLDIRELSPEQRYAHSKFVRGENLFITGPGGTGKTRLIKHLLNHTNAVNRTTAVCAMTGCAAILLNCGARTLHSWSGIKLAKGEKSKVITSVLKNKKAMTVWRAAKVLILDEVSMLSRKIFEIIEGIARQARQSSSPFGGIQVVFTGDFFQLPPIGTEGEPETEQFCFESPLWNSVFSAENHVELKTMFRQTDPTYIHILQQVRYGNLDEEGRKMLRGYVNRKLDTEKLHGIVPTKLFALRIKTDMVNSQMFAQLTGKEYVFEMIQKKDCRTYLDTNRPLDLGTLQSSSKLSEQDMDYELSSITNSVPSPKLLRLKKGAVVMCTINLDMDAGICNGAQGVVVDILESRKSEYGLPTPIVRFLNGVEKAIVPHFWQSEDYPTLAIGQIPLCLAWALTIHKIQGATLSVAEMDIGQSIFEYGQTYVALSRIQSLDGLYLSAFHSQKIMANPKVVAFYDKITGKSTVTT
jgi:ATP-dependent DNA helicase PIF1